MFRSRLGTIALSFSVCSLLTCAGLGAQNLASAGHGPLPPEALALPAHFGVLLGIDARGIFASEEYAGLLRGELPGMSPREDQKAQMREGIAKGLKQLEEQTGLDAERDLDRAVVAIGGFDAKEPDFVVMAMGRFDAARITGAFEATAKGARTFSKRTSHERTLWVVSQAGQPESALVLLDAGTLVFGSAPSVEATLASHVAGRRPLEAATSLLALVEGLDPDASLWMALGPSATSRIRARSVANPPPFPIPDSLTLVGGLGSGLEAVAEMPDDAAARISADMIRGGLAMLRTKMAQAAEATPNAAVNLFDAVTVDSEGKRVRLTAPGISGVAAVGVMAGIAIPSLMRARVSANEAVAIGDTRTIVSAEIAYEMSAQGYGDPACLAEPQACLEGYAGPGFIDPALAGATEKSGYRRTFHGGPAGKRPGTYQAFAYTSTPLEPGQTGTRSFCGDSSGRVCADPTGAPIVPVAGACPASCADLR